MTVSDNRNDPLSTLVANTMLLQAGPVMTRGGKLLSVRGATVVRSMTTTDGPHLFGIADKALSLSQLTEFIVGLQGPVTPDAVPAKEQSERGALVRTLGIIRPDANGPTESLYLSNVSLSGMKFSEESTGWNYWVLNMGDTMTTGAIWEISLQFFVEFNPSG